jgi:DNA helicase-2/ATP-dependent DNA helicase PcrA
MDGILDGLNSEQRQAATATEGYVRVFAGPGTGKTATLARRYAFIIKAIGAPPRCVLCVTFTNKAAGEMKRRILSLTGGGIDPFVRTFHGFCCEFLRDEGKALGLPSDFTLYDVDDVKDAVKEIYAANGIDGRDFTLEDAWEHIDYVKSMDLSYVDDFLAKDSRRLLVQASEMPTLKDKVLYLYMHEQRAAGALDFDDLIALTLKILKDREDVRERWQKRLEYIMVDEFQDIDALQCELVELLSGMHRNLFIVGDPDQTIYTFRGANVKYFTRFPERHPDALCVALKLNYRSTPEILRAAHTLISRNPDPGRVPLEAARKIPDSAMVPVSQPVPAEDGRDDAAELIRMMEGRALTMAPKSRPLPKPLPDVKTRLPSVIFSATPDLEAEYIASMLAKIKSSHPDSTEAVLYRAHHVSTEIEKALIRHRVPYRILSGTGFFGRPEVRTACAYIRLCLNPRDDASFRRAVAEPRRGFGRKRIAELQRLARKEGMGMLERLWKAADEEPDSMFFKGTSALEFAQVMRGLGRECAGARPSLALERILNDTGYEEYLKQSGQDERLKGLASLRAMVRDYEAAEGERTVIADFVRDTALYTALDQEPSRDEVRLMTVHGAKGLEFDYVFIAGLSEGTFPSGKSQNAESVEEERRLMYVAMTRARRQLFMCFSQAFAGSEVQREPSRFLRELSPDEVAELGGKAAGTRGPSGAGAEGAFKEGDRVFHQYLGPGVIREVDRALGEYVVYFESIKKERRMSFSAPLERTEAPVEAESGIDQ